MKEKLTLVFLGFVGIILVVVASYANDILDAIVDGRPTELQVAVGTAIPLVLGALVLILVARELRGRYLIR